MATLEKIRSKSAILFTVIIVALLAFILGDFFNSSRSFFGPGTAAAKVDGQKIDIQEFNRRVENLRQNMQDQGYQNVDQTMLQQRVLQEMVYETLFNNELDKLGIVVTDKELQSAMTGPTALPMLTQQIQQQFQTTPDQFYDMAFNPAKYQIPADYVGQLQQYWIELEKQVEQQLKQEKLANLFMGALSANKLDAKSLFDDNASTSVIEFAKVDYNSLSGDEFKPSDAEINAKYAELKNRFRLDEQIRKVNYVVVDIEPSDDDLLRAEQDVEGALEILNSQEGIDGLSGFFVSNTRTDKKGNLLASTSAILDSLSVGEARLAAFANNTYQLVKLLARNENQRDSVKLDMAILTLADAAHRDSIISLINSKGSFEGIAEVANSQTGITASLLGSDGVQLSQLIEGAQTGRYFTPDTAANAQQIRVIRVNGYTPNVTTYEVAEIEYEVEPSSTTVNVLTDSLRNFIAQNPTAAQFTQQAAQHGYHIFPAQLNQQSLGIGNVPETRSAAKWALNAKKGQVSDIYGDDQTGRLIAVALNDIYEEGFAPVTDPEIREIVTVLATNDKKAAKLIADYAGKANSVEGYAEAMNTKVDTTNVTFGQPAVIGFPINENDLIAAVSAAKQGELNGPMQSNSAVVVFVVYRVDNEGRDFDYNVDRLRFNQQQGAGVLSRNMYNILLGKNKIENNILKFYQD